MRLLFLILLTSLFAAPKDARFNGPDPTKEQADLIFSLAKPLTQDTVYYRWHPVDATYDLIKMGTYSDEAQAHYYKNWPASGLWMATAPESSVLYAMSTGRKSEKEQENTLVEVHVPKGTYTLDLYDPNVKEKLVAAGIDVHKANPKMVVLEGEWQYLSTNSGITFTSFNAGNMPTREIFKCLRLMPDTQRPLFAKLVKESLNGRTDLDPAEIRKYPELWGISAPASDVKAVYEKLAHTDPKAFAAIASGLAIHAFHTSINKYDTLLELLEISKNVPDLNYQANLATLFLAYRNADFSREKTMQIYQAQYLLNRLSASTPTARANAANAVTAYGYILEGMNQKIVEALNKAKEPEELLALLGVVREYGVPEGRGRYRALFEDTSQPMEVRRLAYFATLMRAYQLTPEDWAQLILIGARSRDTEIFETAQSEIFSLRRDDTGAVQKILLAASDTIPVENRAEFFKYFPRQAICRNVEAQFKP